MYDDADKLFADPDVEAVWIATPNQFHAPMAVAAARQGKHVVIEKPMALSIEDGLRMIEAAEDNHVSLLCGHTLGFSPQVRAMRRVIKSGRLGAVRAVNTWAYTDWMVAPRMPDEVDFAQGGGLIYRQVPHQADTVRLLGDGVAQTVRGTTGQWADWRSETPGYYSAYLEFDNGATANIVYNGYGHFMTQEMVPWSQDRGISGADVVGRGAIRRGLRDGSREEHDLKDASRLGGSNSSNRFARRGPSGPPEWVPNHLGILVVSCEGGDIRHSRYGISVYSDDGMQDIAVEEHYRPGARTSSSSTTPSSTTSPCSTMGVGVWLRSRSPSASSSRPTSVAKSSSTTKSGWRTPTMPPRHSHLSSFSSSFSCLTREPTLQRPKLGLTPNQARHSIPPTWLALKMTRKTRGDERGRTAC